MLFSLNDLEEAYKQCNFDKAIGHDGFDGRILQNDGVRRKIQGDLATALNTNCLPKNL